MKIFPAGFLVFAIVDLQRSQQDSSSESGDGSSEESVRVLNNSSAYYSVENPVTGIRYTVRRNRTAPEEREVSSQQNPILQEEASNLRLEIPPRRDSVITRTPDQTVVVSSTPKENSFETNPNPAENSEALPSNSINPEALS